MRKTLIFILFTTIIFALFSVTVMATAEPISDTTESTEAISENVSAGGDTALTDEAGNLLAEKKPPLNDKILYIIMAVIVIAVIIIAYYVWISKTEKIRK